MLATRVPAKKALASQEATGLAVGGAQADDAE